MKNIILTTLFTVFQLNSIMAQDSLHIEGTIDERFNNKKIQLFKYTGYRNSISANLALDTLIEKGKFSFKFPSKTPEIYQLICKDFKKNTEGNYIEKKIEFIADTGSFKINIDSAFQKTIVLGRLHWNIDRDSLEHYLRGDLFDPHQIKKAKINFIRNNPKNPYSSQLLLSLYNHVEDKSLDTLSKILSSKQFDSSTGQFIKFLTDSVIIGKQLSNFQLPDTTGKMVSNKSFIGKLTVFDFWAAWCTPCRKENPYLKKLKEKYGNKLEIVQISFDSSKKEWIDAIKQDQTEMWIHLSELNGWNNTLAKKFNIMSIPANIIVDPNGLIISRNLRGNKLIDTITKIMKGL